MARVHIQQPEELKASDPVIEQRVSDIAKISERCFDMARSSSESKESDLLLGFDCSEELHALHVHLRDDQLRQVAPSQWPDYIAEWKRIGFAMTDASQMLIDAPTGTREKLKSAFGASDKAKAEKMFRACAQDLGRLTDNMLKGFAASEIKDLHEELQGMIAENRARAEEEQNSSTTEA